MKEEPRRDFSVPVRVMVRRDDGEEVEEFALNLSPYGICVHGQIGWEVGEQVTVSFRMPTPGGPAIEAGAHVVWSTHSEKRTLGGSQLWETGLHVSVPPDTAAMIRRWAEQPIDRTR